MNNTIEIIKNHRSIRQYLDKDIPDEWSANNYNHS